MRASAATGVVDRPAFVVRVECANDRCRAGYVAKGPQHVFCSDKCRDAARHRRYYATRPDYVQRNRERFHAWRSRLVGERGIKRQPWLLGAPIAGPHLPGGFVVLGVDPRPQWPVEHRNVRALHGMVTALIGEPHDPTIPGFSLVPWHCGVGWGVYIRGDGAAARLANMREAPARLFDREVRVSSGPLARLKTPAVTKRGRRRLRIDAITPVIIRATGKTRVAYRVQPTAGNLKSTMSTWLPGRLGVALGPDDLRLDVLESATQTERVDLGGKLGAMPGFVGHLVIECNAPAHWLLLAAERVGLGARTAFGFGRIRVTEC